MSELFTALLSYPTVLFGGLLGVVLVYWLFVMLGAVDVDLFDGDGLLGGAGGADGAFEAAAEGIEAASEGAEVEGNPQGTEGLLSALNLRRAPVTVTFSLVVFFAWIASYLAMHYLAPLALGLPLWLFGTGVLLAAILVALPLTSLVTKPLEPVFRSQGGKRRHDYVGSVCVVRTGRVDGGFGQAEIVDGGTHLVIPVRIDTATLSRGDQALIVDYDAEREAYVLEAYESILEDPRAAKAEPGRPSREARKSR